MSLSFTDLLLYFFVFIFLVAGLQLGRGKWLRLIAGNTFGDLSDEQARRCGKFVGSGLIGFAIFFSLIQWNILHGIVLLGLCLVLTIISFGMIIRYLMHWVKIGK